jgi:hypothetical protein
VLERRSRDYATVKQRQTMTTTPRAFQFHQGLTGKASPIYDWQTGHQLPAFQGGPVRIYGMEPGTGKAWDFEVSKDPTTGETSSRYIGQA